MGPNLRHFCSGERLRRRAQVETVDTVSILTGSRIHPPEVFHFNRTGLKLVHEQIDLKIKIHDLIGFGECITLFLAACSIGWRYEPKNIVGIRYFQRLKGSIVLSRVNRECLPCTRFFRI